MCGRKICYTSFHYLVACLLYYSRLKMKYLPPQKNIKLIEMILFISCFRKKDNPVRLCCIIAHRVPKNSKFEHFIFGFWNSWSWFLYCWWNFILVARQYHRTRFATLAVNMIGNFSLWHQTTISHHIKNWLLYSLDYVQSRLVCRTGCTDYFLLVNILYDFFRVCVLYFDNVMLCRAYLYSIYPWSYDISMRQW